LALDGFCFHSSHSHNPFRGSDSWLFIADWLSAWGYKTLSFLLSFSLSLSTTFLPTLFLFLDFSFGLAHHTDTLSIFAVPALITISNHVTSSYQECSETSVLILVILSHRRLASKQSRFSQRPGDYPVS
jgi:hypothetical protein